MTARLINTTKTSKYCSMNSEETSPKNASNGNFPAFKGVRNARGALGWEYRSIIRDAFTDAYTRNREKSVIPATVFMSKDKARSTEASATNSTEWPGVPRLPILEKIPGRALSFDIP